MILSWCLNAKNSLANVHRFSPFQLVLGQNPKLPSTIIDKLPALTPSNTSKILTDNLTALHKAREAFFLCGNSEKIWCAVSNSTQTSRDTKYVSGDSVYFKRVNDKWWKGPEKVVGQDGQQVLVKYGSSYVRVHSCRLSSTRSTNIRSNNTNNQVQTDEIKEIEHKQSQSNNLIPNDEDSEDESEPEQQHEVNIIQDIDTLSTSLEQRSVSNTRP